MSSDGVGAGKEGRRPKNALLVTDVMEWDGMR